MEVKIRLFVGLLFLLAMFILLRFYNHKIVPHTHYLEVILAYLTTGLIVALFVVILLIPSRHRILFTSVITLFFIAFVAGTIFWGIRPYYVIYEEVPKRMEVLNTYLEDTYPERSWEMRKSPSTFDSHYLMLVTFEDEPGKTYHYFMNDGVMRGEEDITSSGWTGQ